MTFELAISTMHKTKAGIFKMLNDMNVHCDCIVINQCNEDMYYDEIVNSQKVRMFFTTERGLSKSRNIALKNAKADILGIADDDLCYYDDFDKIILNYYMGNKNADVVLFNMDDFSKIFSSKTHKCHFLELSGYISMQATFKVSSIKNRGLFFNELFGTGSEHFNSGEENIFLADAYRNNCNIYYCNFKILKREETESSWFKGYNDKLFIFNRGAVYYAISKVLFLPYIIRFAFKNKDKLKPFTIVQSIKLMIEGKDKYLEVRRKDNV